ncbi:MAG: 30S ribosomal protein S21 [Bdellovibrionota bacterium]|nr:30S ribosomal protein S21 [Bdellovibrionota bacterium]
MSESKNNKENFKISIGEGFPVEKALRKFKRLCDSYGITKTYRANQAYQKPSIKAKEKREAAEKRRRKTNSKSSRFRSKI